MDKYQKQYVYTDSALINCGSDRPKASYYQLTDRVMQKGPGGEWERMVTTGDFQEQALVQGTDTVLSWSRASPFELGLSEDESKLIPAAVRRRGRGNTYHTAPLGKGPFLFLEQEYSRAGLVALVKHLQPRQVGLLSEPTEAGEVTFHEAADTYSEWCAVYFKSVTQLLERRDDSLTVTLYSMQPNSGLFEEQGRPQLYVGFHRPGAPQCLLPLEQAAGELGGADPTYAGLDIWWSREQVAGLSERSAGVGRDERASLMG